MSSLLVPDGALQKQILLLKMIHEMENRPCFGTMLIDDPDSEVRRWFSRIGAILTRIGPVESARFGVILQYKIQNWTESVNSIQSLVYDAIEKLKLELELSGDDNFGQVYSAGEQYRFNKDLLSIVGAAQSEVFVVDPYFDASMFTILFPEQIEVDIRILLTKNASAVTDVAAKGPLNQPSNVEVRSTKNIHDRLIIIDKTECWVVGASLKDAGVKPTYLLPLIPDLAQKKAKLYEDMWLVS